MPTGSRQLRVFSSHDSPAWGWLQKIFRVARAKGGRFWAEEILSALQRHLEERRGGVQVRAGIQPVLQLVAGRMDVGAFYHRKVAPSAGPAMRKSSTVSSPLVE